MTDHARSERAALADLLLAEGPDAPTLCVGWTTRDLAAHVVVRERRPDAVLARLIPVLDGHREHVRADLAARPYEQIIHLMRNPPWWSPLSNPLTDELLNTLEFFIHHEDVRRAAPDWQPRELSTDLQGALWRAVRFTARLGLGKLGVPIVVRAPGFGEVTVGSGEPQASIVGDPGELALFCSGRQRAARVTVDAPAQLATRLGTARLGL